ncbi:reverse transcriptase domain-containing protein [Tanacetum coccineum]
MSTHEQHTPTIPTSAVRNTGGRSGPQGLEEPTPDEQDELKAVKARLLYGDESGRNPRNHEESHYSESKTPTARTEPRRGHGGKHSRSPLPIASVFKRLRRNGPPSLRPRPRKEDGVFNWLGGKEQSAYARSDSRHQSSQAKGTEVQPMKHHHRGTSSRGTSRYSESEDSEGGHRKSKSKRHRSNTYEDDLSQHWTCEERKLFTPWIWNFDFPRTRMPSHVKTYDGSRVWFDKLPKESIDSYEDLRAAFRENYLQQTKHIKDPVEIHHIKQRDGESTEDFMERYKAEVLDVEGEPECMKICGFMHGITHPELIKLLYEKILKSMDEVYRVTTSFLQEEDRGDDQIRVAKQRVTQSFSPETVISFPPLGEEDGTEGPMIIEAEMGGHFVHRMYVYGGASSEVLYEHCFVRLQPKLRSQMIPVTIQLIGFSGETIWPLGQISLLVKIGDEEHSTSAWMNFMVIRSPSQHNGIIGRTGIRKIRAIPSTAYGMLKFLVEGGAMTLRSSRVISMECAMISGPSTQPPVTSQVLEEKIKVAIHSKQ